LSRMHLSVDQMGRLAGREISFAYLPESLEEVRMGAAGTRSRGTPERGPEGHERPGGPWGAGEQRGNPSEKGSPVP
ncbi:MAG: hypothetical protein OEO23_05945, partial [Gemmatimonadota bacterium]|nr:hypothetical protein [Gemmatimonadota bacterium]